MWEHWGDLCCEKCASSTQRISAFWEIASLQRSECLKGLLRPLSFKDMWSFLYVYIKRESGLDGKLTEELKDVSKKAYFDLNVY